MNRKGLLFASAGIAVLLAGGLASASGQEPAEGPARSMADGRGNVPDIVALQELMDSYALMQAQRQLQLTPDQAPQFILRLRDLQQARRRVFRQRVAIIQELRRLTQGGRGQTSDADAAQINERLRSLDDLDVRSADDVKQAMANLDQVLEPFQRARFRILEEQLERNKVEILLRARRARGNEKF
jgi:hypothetical protein